MAQGWDGAGPGPAGGLLALCMVGHVVAAICVCLSGGALLPEDAPVLSQSRRSPRAARPPPAARPWSGAGPPAGGGHALPGAAGGGVALAAAVPEAAAAAAGGARGAATPAEQHLEAGGDEGAVAAPAVPVDDAADAAGSVAAPAVPVDDAADAAAHARATAKCAGQVIRHRTRNRACMERYRELMIGMAREPGIDIVFGANDGIQFEPAVYIGYWKRVPHHTRVLVEPVPPLFAKLSKNLANLTTTPVLINKAVKIDGSSDSLDLYCFDTSMVDDWVLHGRNPLPEEVRKPEGFWNALCSTDKHQLLGRANILDTPAYRKLAPGDKKRVLNEVENVVRLHHVPAATPADMIAEVSAREGLSAGLVKYVQIDVEAMDKDIMLALPLGKNHFLPKVILWEGCYGEDFKHLTEHGYESCCCVNIYGTNTLAYRP